MGVSTTVLVGCDAMGCPHQVVGVLRLMTGKHWSLDVPEGWLVEQRTEIDWLGEKGWKLETYCPEHAEGHAKQHTRICVSGG